MSDTRIDEKPERLDDVFKITQSDLYQMFTYSNLYKADGTVLVFPGGENKLDGPYNFKKDGFLFWVLMLRLDFNKDTWEKELIEDLRSKFNELSR
jgi:5-methylcytosine-specific restriction endonuclease McrBC regulatory subunit McrC